MTENFFKHQVNGQPAVQVPLCLLRDWSSSLWHENWGRLHQEFSQAPLNDYFRLSNNDYQALLLIVPDKLLALQLHPSNLLPLQWAVWEATSALGLLWDMFRCWEKEEVDEISKRHPTNKRVHAHWKHMTDSWRLSDKLHDALSMSFLSLKHLRGNKNSCKVRKILSRHYRPFLATS